MSVLSTTSAGSTLPSNLVSSATLGVNGLISGIDTTKVIQGLVAIDQQKITDMDAAKANVQAQQAAFKQIEAKLLALQGTMTALSRSQNGLFDARTATSSNDDAISAAASSSAVAGVYQMRITSLASANQIASQGFDAPTSSVTQGTLQFQVGDTTTSVTIDSTNDTLQGLANAINTSGAPIIASVINDGSGDGHQSYRLMLSSQQTGTSNRINITNNLADSSGGATKPTFDVGSIGNAVLGTGFTGTAAVTANAGAGYTGTTNNRYTFTVVTGGTVGTDNGLQIAYTDSTGANTGTLTVNAADADTFLNVGQGVQVKLSTGTLVAGQTFDVKTFVPTVQTATDASVTLGSGDGALTITSATNELDSLIPGVALQLKQADPNTTQTITIANDTDGMTKGITDFVGAYNDLMSFINTQTAYDSTSNQAGILLGNRQATTIQEQVRSIFQNVVPGANTGMNYLGALGISTDQNGTLNVDTTKLGNILAGRQPGVTIADVRTLFALTGNSSNPGIQFVTGSTKTKASTTPYTVNITQAASAALVTGSAALAASTVIDGTNNTLQVTLDGKTSSLLTLTAGTYSRQALAQAVQAALDSDTALAGASASVVLSGNSLSIHSDRVGAASQVAIQTGSALTALGFSAGAASQGKDVAGNFVVNGFTEPATGFGQFLAGNPDNANTANLQLNVSLTPAQVGSGLQANVNVVRGIASRLDAVLTGLLDPVSGRMKTIDDSFQANVDQINDQEAKQNAFIQARTSSLQLQFQDMEDALSKLQSASQFLGTQATSLK